MPDKTKFLEEVKALSQKKTECYSVNSFVQLSLMDTFDDFYFNKCLSAFMGFKTGSFKEKGASLEKMKFHAEAISAWCDFFISYKCIDRQN